jgi:hypothetical protein
VIPTTTFEAEPFVSTVPKLPISGVATVQSVVSYGQPAAGVPDGP